MTTPRRYPGEIFLENYPPISSSTPLAVAAYPNRYRTGMSNLGFHFLFSGLSRSGMFRVERVFLDRKHDTKNIATIFITISYEEDLINAVKMLYSLGIEPLRSRRKDGPIVVVGGPVVSSNPVPFFPLADVVVAGEGERSLPLIVQAVSDSDGVRRVLNERLAGEEGVIIPGHTERTGRAGPISPRHFQRSVILSSGSVFPGMMLSEISRGCPGSCCFCMATSIYRPFRTVSLEDFESFIDSAVDIGAAAVEGIGLVSTAAAAHPDFVGMLDALRSKGLRVGLSSLRAIDIDGEKAAAIGRAGVKSVSLAPESGSERIRRRLGKNVPDTRYFEAARMLSRVGVKRFSLYMLSGIPSEDDTAFAETRRFIAAFAEAAGGAGVTVKVNTLVPKPRTPLQFMAMPQPASIRASVSGISDVCRSTRVRVSLKGLRSSLNQSRIALGDEAVGRAAVRFAAGRTSWKRALKDEGVDPDYIHHERGTAETLPWERVFGDEGKDSLLKRYKTIIT